MVAQLQRITLDSEQVLSDTLQLTPAQQHYLCRVLRLKSGDRFLALNGKGQQWLATLTDTDAIAQIVSQIAPPEPQAPPVMLLAALPKGNGFDEVVRQATEIGVAQIVPIISERTLLRPSAQKLNRWHRIATEAAEQSERLVVPAISTPMSFGDSLKLKASAVGLICVARSPKLTANEPVPPVALSHYLTQHDWPSPLAIAIGPEGGWTRAEVEAAIAVDYHPVTLGSSILRAVTASIVALALVNAAWTAP